MWRPSFAVTVALIVVTTTAAGIVAPSNEAPLADAGLDQEVTKGTTVHLDGTGSRDPDGDIEKYRWTIRTPSDATVTPDCRTCARTSFDPAETGRYRVTLTVTDGDGATQSDTFYVDVSPGAEPTLSLSGPQNPTEGGQTTYTAAFDPGAAALDRVVWTVDGTEIAPHSLSGTQSTDTVTKRFPTAGSRTVAATVYDADGQTSASSIEVVVRSDSDPTPPSRSSDRDPTASTADRSSPIVEGDAIVTGSKPLQGQYSVGLDAPVDAVESIRWRNAAGLVGRGTELTWTWEPGDHELYAVVTYADGSENVATFADGNTSVVADSAPNASFASLDRFGSLSGTVDGLDEYENLEKLRVEVDGDVVATTRSTVHGRTRYGTDRQQTLRFSYHDFTPGERSEVTVVATDERGQTSRASTETVPVKEPEIVRSEFVNSPVTRITNESTRNGIRHSGSVEILQR